MAIAMREIRITGDDDGTRLDRFIRRQCDGINQGRIEKLLRAGAIRIDGARAKSNARLAAGQSVTMPAQLSVAHGKPVRADASAADAETIKILRDAVIAKGDGWLAINKPAGLASQGGTGIRAHIDGALADAFPDSETAPRLVHRLDRDTSGVMVVATSRTAARALAQGFKNKTHAKTYLGLTRSVPPAGAGLIDTPLAKSGGRGIEKMHADANGVAAKTQYAVLESFGKSASLVALRPLTGRTHQLRAHMASIDCALLGDGKYGGRESFPHKSITRLCLHAAHLVLQTGEVISAEIPADLHPAFALFGIAPDDALRRAAQKNLFGEVAK